MKNLKISELIGRAPWREAVTYRNTWPHEYVLSHKDGQHELFELVCARFRAGEGVGGLALRGAEMVRVAAWSIDARHGEGGSPQSEPRRVRRSPIGLERYLEDWIVDDVTLIGEGFTLLERMNEFLGRFDVPISVVSFEVFELEGGPKLLIREVVDEPTRRPPSSRQLSLEAIRGLAIDMGVGKQFDLLGRCVLTADRRLVTGAAPCVTGFELADWRAGREVVSVRRTPFVGLDAALWEGEQYLSRSRAGTPARRPFPPILTSTEPTNDDRGSATHVATSRSVLRRACDLASQL